LLLRHVPLQFLTRIAIRYGAIARIPLARGSLYLVSGPELIKTLLVDHRTRFIKNTRYSVMQRLLGQGLLLSEGDVWRRQRLAAQPSFKPGALQRQVSWMSPLIAEFLDGWGERENEDAVIELSREFERLAQSIAGRLLFGSVFARHAAAIVGITESMRKCWPSVPPFLRPLTKQQQAANALELAQTLANLDAEILTLIRAVHAHDARRRCCGRLRALHSSRAVRSDEDPVLCRLRDDRHVDDLDALSPGAAP
jgi:cytochrome P450